VVICLEQGADLHTAQLMPLPLTVSCFSKIQFGFAFLVPAHPGSPGKRAVKRMCVCVRVCAGRICMWRPWAGSLLVACKTEWWGWCGCLSGARCRQLYDVHLNSMTYTLFFIPDYQFQKVFYVSLGNNFYCFCGGPLVVEAPGQLPSLPPPV